MIQIISKRSRITYEDYSDCPQKVLPLDRVPTLFDLVDMVTTGRPLDSNVVRNLEYNDFEKMFIFQKGIDLADICQVAKQNGKTLAEIQEEIDKAQANAKGVDNLLQNPNQEVPDKVEPSFSS